MPDNRASNVPPPDDSHAMDTEGCERNMKSVVDDKVTGSQVSEEPSSILSVAYKTKKGRLWESGTRKAAATGLLAQEACKGTHLIARKHVVSTLRKAIKRRANTAGFFFFVSYLVLYFGVLSTQQNIPFAYELESAVKEAVDSSTFASCGEEDCVRRSLYDLKSYEHLYSWLKYALVPKLLEKRLDPVTPAEPNRNYLLGFNRVMTGFRLVQTRRKVELDCQISPKFKEWESICFGVGGLIDETPYGPSHDPEKYEAEGSGVDRGFQQDFLHDISISHRQLDELQKDGWIDQRTKTLHVTFTVYHHAVNLFTFCDIEFDLSAFGIISPKYHTVSATLEPYVHVTDWVRCFFEILLLCMSIVQLVVETYDLNELCRAYGVRALLKALFTTEIWELWDTIRLSIFFMEVVTWISIVLHPSRDIDLPSREYKSLAKLMGLYGMYNSTHTVSILVSTVVLFKYLAKSDRMAYIINAFSLAWPEISLLLLVFFIVFSAYSLAGNILFGHSLEMYHTFLQSCGTSFQMFRGKVPINILEDVSPDVGLLYYYSFTISLSIIFYAFIMAIVIEAFKKNVQWSTSETTSLAVEFSEDGASWCRKFLYTFRQKVGWKIEGVMIPEEQLVEIFDCQPPPEVCESNSKWLLLSLSDVKRLFEHFKIAENVAIDVFEKYATSTESMTSESLDFAKLADFLGWIGFKHLLPVFVKHEIGFETLDLLTEVNVAAMGLPVGQQVRLWRAIQKELHEWISRPNTTAQSTLQSSEINGDIFSKLTGSQVKIHPSNSN